MYHGGVYGRADRRLIVRIYLSVIFFRRRIAVSVITRSVNHLPKKKRAIVSQPGSRRVAHWGPLFRTCRFARSGFHCRCGNRDGATKQSRQAAPCREFNTYFLRLPPASSVVIRSSRVRTVPCGASRTNCGRCSKLASAQRSARPFRFMCSAILTARHSP
jgi:hypothetical protein